MCAKLLSLVPYAAISVSLLAAALGLRAATFPIRETINHLTSDIGRQGKWASWAALAAALSAVLQSIDRFLQ
ncbi:hypothetical protein SAMN05428967_2271 [Phyllobacterium sp. YR620]|nr:hypothetical protein SAMN05428967_2271 [Phyllobacterium sp. YR620]